MRPRLIPVFSVVALIAAAAAALAVAAKPIYQPPVQYTAGASAYPVATADFNGDGRLDVATGNEDDDDVSILLGTGKKGAFTENGDFASAAYPFGIVAEDFVGDDAIDLAVAGLDGDNVGLMEGDGDGGFGTPTFLLVGDGPVSVASADLNGDGRLDLAVANENDKTVSVLFGKGGGFKPAKTFPAGIDPTSVAIAQVDGKAGLDIAVLDYATGVQVLRGSGSGEFKPAELVPVALDSAYGFAVAQIDKKARTDIWISTCDGAGADANVMLLAKGKTGLGYKPQVNRPGGDCAYEVEVKDVDGNGYKDPIVTSEGNGTVSVTFNSKKGLKSPKDYPAVSEAYSVASGDFNNDGIRDFAVPDYQNPRTAIVLSG